MSDVPRILLVPVNGSKGANQAAAMAARLAERLDVPVRLLCAFPEDAFEAFGFPGTSSQGFRYFSPEEFDKLRRQTTDNAFASAREAMGEVGVSVEQEVLSGEAAPAIVEHARRVDSPMIVIGSRGLNRFTEAVIGSVSQRVLHHADCPVLIVH